MSLLKALALACGEGRAGYITTHGATQAVNLKARKQLRTIPHIDVTDFKCESQTPHIEFAHEALHLHSSLKMLAGGRSPSKCGLRPEPRKQFSKQHLLVLSRTLSAGRPRSIMRVMKVRVGRASCSQLATDPLLQVVLNSSYSVESIAIFGAKSGYRLPEVDLRLRPTERTLPAIFAGRKSSSSTRSSMRTPATRAY